MKLSHLLFILLIIVSSCKDSENTSSGKRPHDPFVFRSVLDLKPRIITMALHNDLWAAYSTEHCALYKTWKGVVYFQGSVYNTQHGPQPISIGDGYQVENFSNPWFLLKNGTDTIKAITNYKGHKFVNDQAILMYQIMPVNSSFAINIEELVEAKSDNSGVAYERKFTVKNIPQSYKLGLKTNVSSIVVKENIKTNGEFVAIKSNEVQLKNDRISLNIEGVLFLKEGRTDFTITYMSTPTIANTNNVEGGEDNKDNADLPYGAKLIASSDCKTCHNKSLKTVGPAYIQIAEKYENNESNKKYLVQKVKAGGSGVWGNVAMSAHGDLPESDIEQMVDYILGLSNKAKVAATEEKIPSFPFDAQLDTNKLLPGAITKVYNLKKGTASVPVFDPKMKPRNAGIKNNFDNVDGHEFADLTDDFSLLATGYIRVEKAGEYTLEIWSDDGSKLYLHNQLLIDNDGAHGTVGKFGKVKLDKGYHPFRMEYFQGGGGKYLSLNWIKPGDERAEVIPVGNIFHSFESGEDFTGLTLPMANISQIPGNKSALTGVHPAFTLSQARPDDFEPKVAGMDFKKDGRLVVSTWDENGSVWIIENASSGDPSKMKVKRIAAGLAEPLGLKVVDDTIFVMQKQEMTKLVDVNGDDIIDEYHTLCDDWGVSANFHEFGFGLEYKDGYFYATLATAIQPGGASTNPQIPDRGKVIKVNRNTGKLEFIASGLRTPNGIGIGYNGEIFVADNQGDWLPSSKIVHVTNGAWFGSRSVDFEGTAKMKEKQPLVWLPQDEIGNSPSTPSYINVGPYKGQMIHGEVTHGGIKRVFVEEINGELQGCVFRFIQGLEAGVNRIKWAPDGSLYVGGIGNPGNWGHAGGKWFGLQRLTYNNKSVFEMLAVRAKSNGMEIEFTEPLAIGEGLDPKNYEIKQWYYKPTVEYGGPKLGETVLPIKSITLSEDRKKAFVELSGLKAGHVVYIRFIDGLISAPGNSMWSTEAWYTMNSLSTEKGIVNPSKEKFVDNTLTEQEKKDGWMLLFDGKKIDQFRNFKKKTIGSGWVINDNAIHLNAVKEEGKWQAKDAGDIITNESYENFEFKYEWKITNCGNSGVIFNIVEADKYDYVWHTGPEMQVLDNICHPDTRYPTHRAGDLYDLIESKFPCSKPAGQWNKAMIKSKDGKVDFYLNGYKTVSFDIRSKEWKDMIAKSKFKDMPDFGLAKGGHIALQDHGDKVWFKNIKIRKL